MSEAAWRRRFRAANITLPSWARDNPNRATYGSNAGGKWEMYAWDIESGEHRQLTDRPSGTMGATFDPRGEQVWWFDDERGNELGQWMSQPFGGGDPARAAPSLDRTYGAGLAVGTGFSIIGQSVRGAHRFQLCRDGEQPVLIYESAQAAGVGGLSYDESLLVYSHAENDGDSRNRALRVVDLDGKTIADLWDGPKRGVAAGGWSRVPGDNRLIVTHERSGVRRPAVWDPHSGSLAELDIDLPGEVGASWYPDGDALLLAHMHRGRTELYRYDLAARTAERVETEAGTIGGARVRPDGDIWYAITRSSTPPEIRSARSGSLLRPPGERAPAGVAYRDVDVGDVHAFIAEPRGARPHPTVFQVHGGPSGQDVDSFAPGVQAWVDHGFCVVMVNYRGSSGYGKEWRDAIVGRIGLTELEDIAAVRERVVAEGIADPERIVLGGGSWGGYLTLLGVGAQPDLWSLGVSGVPLADLESHYHEQAEPLRVYFRSLAGGSPEEVPELYRERSPITYADKVRVPVLILAGENDPRCPIGQVNNYVARMEELGADHEVYRYDAGHGSLVIDETIRQMELRLDFVARHLATPKPQ